MSIEMNRVGNGAAKQHFDDTAQPLLNTSDMKNGKLRSQSALIENGKDSPVSQEENSPKDRYNLIMLFFILHGVGTLMPWNSFINANSYFSDYKLTHVANGTATASEHKEFFLSYLGICANVPGLLFNIINIFAPLKGGNYTWRIVPAIIIEIGVMIFTIILAVKDTSDWMSGFFYSTIASVIVLNLANGVYQNSIFGLASKFPMRFTGYVILGNNICGTFTSVANIVSQAISPSIRIAAVYYFVSALTVLLLAVDTFLALPINRFYRLHLAADPKEKALIKEKADEIREEEEEQKPVPYCLIFSYCWKQCLNVFMVFFVSLAIFPVIQCNIFASDKTFFFGDADITKGYYVSVLCFFVFNFSAMIGNLIPNWYIAPSPSKLWIPVVLRFAFIPFFLMCNLQPQGGRSWPVYFDNDYIYLLGGIVMAMSSGYFSSLAMMYAPRSAPPEYAGIAAMMAAAFLMSGIFLGVTASPYIMMLVK